MLIFLTDFQSLLVNPPYLSIETTFVKEEGWSVTFEDNFQPNYLSFVELPMCSLGDKWDWQTVGGEQQTGGPAATTHLRRVKSIPHVVMIDAGTALVNMLHRQTASKNVLQKHSPCQAAQGLLHKKKKKNQYFK